MSKGRGKKIAIKFDKPLLGDVSGNEAAFTVTGLEKSPLFYGTPTERQYAVDSVERYPIAELWQDDFSGTLDGVEVGENGLVLHKPTMAVTDSAAYETVSGTSLQGTVEANAGDFVLATVSIRDSVQTPTPTGWTLLYETYVSHTDFDQRLAFFYKKIETSGTVIFTATQPSSNRIYLNLIAISGIEGFSAKPDMTVVRTTETGAFSVPDKSPGEPLVWGCVAALWATSAPYGDWVITPNDLLLVSLDQAITAPRLANFIDLGDGAATGRTMQASPKTSGSYVAVAAIGLINKYSTPSTYITTIPTATLPANPRLRFEANTPEDTTVTVEYACTDDDETPPETWMSVDDEDLLTINDDYLWLRYTLETEDTSKTPTLLAVWLEEAEAPPGTILLTMTPDSRFNDAEGDITVSYEREKGTLTGNRPVEDFEESFTPEDLEPSPVDEHIITVTGEPVVDFINVIYHDYPDYVEHTITVTGTGVLVDFIHVDDIPP